MKKYIVHTLLLACMVGNTAHALFINVLPGLTVGSLAAQKLRTNIEKDDLEFAYLQAMGLGFGAMALKCVQGMSTGVETYWALMHKAYNPTSTAQESFGFVQSHVPELSKISRACRGNALAMVLTPLVLLGSEYLDKKATQNFEHYTPLKHEVKASCVNAYQRFVHTKTIDRSMLMGNK